MPTVTAIIPAYNRESHLRVAIESVRHQTFKDWELIIVDDGSTDNIGDLARSYAKRDGRIRYVYQKNMGVAKARNSGILMARGRYIAFLDDDDQWLPEKLEAQIAIMEADPSIGLTYSRFRTFHYMSEPMERANVQPRELPELFEDLLWGRSWLAPSTYLVRYDALKEDLLFNPAYEVTADADFILRFVQRWKMKAIPEVLSFTVKDGRQHESRNVIRSLKEILKIYENLKLMPGYEYLKGAVHKHIARLNYGLGCEHYEVCDYRTATRYFLKAVLTYWLVGLMVRRHGEEGLKLLFRVAKAYLAIPICLTKGLLYARR